MKIRFRIQGGFAQFPRLTAGVLIDTAVLAPAERAEVEAAVGEARLLEQPPQRLTPGPRARDHRTYQISIEDGARQSRVVVSDPLPPEFRRVVSVLRELSRRRSSAPG